MSAKLVKAGRKGSELYCDYCQNCECCGGDDGKFKPQGMWLVDDLYSTCPICLPKKGVKYVKDKKAEAERLEKLLEKALGKG